MTAGKRPVPMGFEQSVPGYMVMFIMMNQLMYGGISVAGERRSVLSQSRLGPGEAQERGAHFGAVPQFALDGERP